MLSLLCRNLRQQPRGNEFSSWTCEASLLLQLSGQTCNFICFLNVQLSRGWYVALIILPVNVQFLKVIPGYEGDWIFLWSIGNNLHYVYTMGEGEVQLGFERGWGVNHQIRLLDSSFVLPCNALGGIWTSGALQETLLNHWTKVQQLHEGDWCHSHFLCTTIYIYIYMSFKGREKKPIQLGFSYNDAVIIVHFTWFGVFLHFFVVHTYNFVLVDQLYGMLIQQWF